MPSLYKGKRTGRIRKTPKGVYRKRMKRRVIHANPKMIYDITLNAEAFTFTVPAGGSNTYEFAPSLSDITSGDLQAFQGLYDEFKITGFTWMLKPRGNIAYANNGATGPNGQNGFQYYSVLDYSDTNTLASVDAALEYSNVKFHQSWRNAKRYVPCMCPKLIHDVNNNPLLVIEKPRWMQLDPQTIQGTDYDDTIVAVLGSKIITEVNNSAYDQIFDLYLKINVQFRNKK